MFSIWKTIPVSGDFIKSVGEEKIKLSRWEGNIMAVGKNINLNKWGREDIIFPVSSGKILSRE